MEKVLNVLGMLSENPRTLQKVARGNDGAPSRKEVKVMMVDMAMNYRPMEMMSLWFTFVESLVEVRSHWTCFSAITGRVRKDLEVVLYHHQEGEKGRDRGSLPLLKVFVCTMCFVILCLDELKSEDMIFIGDPTGFKSFQMASSSKCPRKNRDDEFLSKENEKAYDSRGEGEGDEEEEGEAGVEAAAAPTPAPGPSQNYYQKMVQHFDWMDSQFDQIKNHLQQQDMRHNEDMGWIRGILDSLNTSVATISSYFTIYNPQPPPNQGPSDF
ncbi:hypothetical protein M5K25_022156 [Dendrobium thyrsiflorum]|uniref:Uncharacterized protein n=1 Tax=Dendrobium thyrsiflorum TaxID=117978 RepID=A0ABD0U5M3_DENTH